MHRLERTLRRLLPAVQSVISTASVTGGCISNARRVVVRYRDSDHGNVEKTLFVKSNDESFFENFQCEWEGLECLSKVGALVVPQPLGVGIDEGQAWLVMQWIQEEPKGRQFFRDFGRGLAKLHHATAGTRIGWRNDNFLGAARQINSPCETWVEFVADRRLGFQLRWAVDQGLADAPLRRDVEKIIGSIPELLVGRDDSTSLLHGDLWSGNYLCGDGGKPVIINPAVYHGCREAEFGMLRLYGSCPPEFYESYQDVFSMPAGWQRRVSVYVLYHLLNHLNLFGTAYLGQCRSIATEILS